MNEINLNSLKLKTFTEQDTLDYCQLNDINIEDITGLYLNNNYLENNISGIKLFKNLKGLNLSNNQIKDISIIEYLNSLEYLNIESNKLTDISIIKNLTKLKYFYIGNNPLIDISVIKYLKIETLGIINLKLESDQIQYINSVNTIKTVFSNNKNINNKLNKNILKIQ